MDHKLINGINDGIEEIKNIYPDLCIGVEYCEVEDIFRIWHNDEKLEQEESYWETVTKIFNSKHEPCFYPNWYISYDYEKSQELLENNMKLKNNKTFKTDVKLMHVWNNEYIKSQKRYVIHINDDNSCIAFAKTDYNNYLEGNRYTVEAWNHCMKITDDNKNAVQPLKMYVLIKDWVDVGHSINSATHAGCAINKHWPEYSDPIMQEWYSDSFRKVTCKVTEEQFEKAKTFGDDWFVITELQFDKKEVILVLKPRREWPKFFKFLKLYK